MARAHSGRMIAVPREGKALHRTTGRPALCRPPGHPRPSPAAIHVRNPRRLFKAGASGPNGPDESRSGSMKPMVSTGESVRGLTTTPVSALRYNSKSADPYESSGLLMSMIPQGSRVLDIGCGTGSISGMIRDLRRADVLGIEPHPERAKKAESEGIKVIQGVYSPDVPVKYGKFDVVLFADVLEHLTDPAETLEQAKSALTPDGRILASIPNVAHWSVRLRLLAGKFDYEPTGIMDATHLRWFTRKSVRRLFDGAGYDIEYFHSAAGGWMHEYHRTPLRWVPYDKRSFVLSKFRAVAPGLFSVQHVVSAKVR